MLETLRKGTGSWMVKILLGLLVMSFAAWGIGDIFTGGGDTSVAQVGDTKISPNQYRDAYQNRVRQMSARFGKQLNNDEARQLGIGEQTLQQLVTSALWDEAANKFGLAVPDSVVGADIRNNRAFQDEAGNFNKLQYEGVLRNAGMNPAYYEQLTRGEMKRQQLLGAMVSGAIAPRRMAETLYRYREEKRVAEIVVIANSTISDIPTPDTAALTKFHDEQKTRYTAPEYRTLTWLTLTAEDLVDDVVVTEEEIKADYDTRIDEFTIIETRDLDQLQYATEEDALAAHKLLMAGAKFEEVSKDPKNRLGDNIALGLKLATELPEATRKAVFAAPPNTVTEPVKSLFGWHIYRVKTIVPGSVKTLAEVHSVIQTTLKLNKAGELVYDQSTRLEDELAGGSSLQDAAQRFDLKLMTAAAVDAGGKDAAGKDVGLPKVPEFINTAFSTEEGADPRLVESSNGSYFMVRVDGITAPAVRPLETVREAVVTDWTAQQRNDAAGKKAAAMVKVLKDGGDFKAEADKLGLTIKETKPVGRFRAETEPDMSFDLLTAMFKARVGGMVTAPNQAGTVHVVARVKTVIAAVPGKNAKLVEAMQAQLRGGISGDIMEQYRAVLQKDYKVTVNRAMMDQLQ
jgi:peptidyl-prolyl cis-trans isomerase D